MDRFLERLPNLEVLLWILASVIAFALFLYFVPTFFGAYVPTATPIALRPTLPTATRTPTATSLSPSAAVRSQPSLPTPTLAPGAQVLTIQADLPRSGWIVSGDANPHWGDRNLHAGFFQGQTFQSLLYFDLAPLAPGSRILSADVQLTGLSGSNLGSGGSWTLKLLPPDLTSAWAGHPSSDYRNAADRGIVGRPLAPADLTEAQVNHFVFSADQLTQLMQAVDTSGRITFRLDGPSGPDQSLFTWDAGDRDPQVGARPVLWMMVIPGQFEFITNTPTPANVMTAAANVARSTEMASLNGTPTPLSRRFATVAPDVYVTPTPTPASPATATANAEYATAVAVTTGTFTPTPPNWIVATLAPVTATPTPTGTPTVSYVGLRELTPIPITATPTEVSVLEYAKTPLPSDSGLIGNIAFVTDREGPDPQYWVMNPNGAAVGKFNGRQYYQIAAMHDLFSPDNAFHLDVDKDENGKWEILLFNVAQGTYSPLIKEDRRAPGIGVYHEAWSPAGDKVAFVSERTGNSEIYVYDMKTKKTTRLTETAKDQNGDWASNKHPSWSPDGSQIVFDTNRGTITRWQIWIMNADGSGQRCLSPSPYSDWDPVWMKR
ncbi:MAG: hypothetical protein M1570_16265 [Chloroflexi bacterium]|nr:hypothetical protein [Chloroflexota bacterium]